MLKHLPCTHSHPKSHLVKLSTTFNYFKFASASTPKMFLTLSKTCLDTTAFDIFNVIIYVTETA